MAYSIGGAGRGPFGQMGPMQGPMGAQLPALPLPAGSPSQAEAVYRAEIEKALNAQREKYKADPFDALLNFGLGALASSSQPGANIWSAIGNGGMNAMQANRAARGEFLQDQAIEGRDSAQRLGLLGQLAAGERPQFQSVRDLGLVQTNAQGGPKVVLPAAQSNAPNSDIGKLRADLDAGRITQEEFQTGVGRIQRQALTAIEQQAVAAGMEPGTPEFRQFVREAVMKPSANVSVTSGPQFGNIPPGYMMRKGANGYEMVPVPGGPADFERSKVTKAEGEAEKQQGATANIVIEDIDRIFDIVKNKAVLPTTGAVGSALSGVGGTSSRDVAGLVGTVKSNIGFDKLSEMRKASPTGAALGNVTERELTELQRVSGDLDQSQTQEQFLRNLARVRNKMLDVVHGPGNGPERMPLRQATQARPSPRDPKPQTKPTGEIKFLGFE